jgi:UDP-N-acetyl-D-galactosamine dehydrogenase
MLTGYTTEDEVVAVIGLGYVGFPLAVAFGSCLTTIGYDLDKARINEIKKGLDKTYEITQKELAEAKYLKVTAETADLKLANNYIIAVPTPIDYQNQPDLDLLKNACRLVARFLKAGDLIVFESTVFPGATENICVPIIEEISNLTYNKDFYCGYSPERINPGDKDHTLTNIVKVVSGSNHDALAKVTWLYSKIVKAGIYKAGSIAVAEAAKVIENIQRDINIALINELSMLFAKLNLDTNEVLDAACSKWNFLNFRPGLVGGHCIGVDPYYLTHRAREVGFESKIIETARFLNNNMVSHVCDLICCDLKNKGHDINGSRVIIFGVTFKENCPDIRNSKVLELASNLRGKGLDLVLHDPLADPELVQGEIGIRLRPDVTSSERYDLVLLAVGHREYLDKGSDYFTSMKSDNGIFFDLKGCFLKGQSDRRL